MATIDKEKTLEHLKAIGFTDAQNKNDDHSYLDYYYEGNFILYVKVSDVSIKDTSSHQINKMAKQCRLSKDQFLELAKGVMNADQYIEILKGNGDIGAADGES